jgi:hypothetical protein
MHPTPDAKRRRGDHAGEVISPASDRATRVLLVDRPGFARSVLARLLGAIPGVLLVGESDADELGKLLPATRPDLLVVDDRLLATVCSSGGADTLRLIVVGVDDDQGYAQRALRVGAEAWVDKASADAVLPSLLTVPVEISPPDREPVRPPDAALGSGR